VLQGATVHIEDVLADAVAIIYSFFVEHYVAGLAAGSVKQARSGRERAR
jgi:hypothetical protein